MCPNHLYSLASGAPVSSEVELDVLRAEPAVKEAKELFIRDRFMNACSETLFFEPITRQKLKIMEDSNKTVSSLPHRERYVTPNSYYNYNISLAVL